MTDAYDSNLFTLFTIITFTNCAVLTESVTGKTVPAYLPDN